MKHEHIGPAGSGAISRIPARCGEVTVGCTDVAGIVQEVIRSSERLRAEHIALRGTVEALELDQRKVSDASDEARQLSERAIERLGQGTSLIQSSLGQITALLELVDTLTQHVTGFAADPLGRTRWGTPPGEHLFAAEITGALAHTQGGLVVDAAARALRPDGTPIPRLFAAGGAACGVSGTGAAGYVPGNGLAQAFAPGLLAGEAAADA
ncbi:FAD-binding protein [Leptolyngbya sp. 15MV]|nr:FAD-binding protein [Leptolyngbya sp. 15MV]